MRLRYAVVVAAILGSVAAAVLVNHLNPSMGDAMIAAGYPGAELSQPVCDNPKEACDDLRARDVVGLIYQPANSPKYCVYGFTVKDGAWGFEIQRSLKTQRPVRIERPSPAALWQFVTTHVPDVDPRCKPTGA